MSDTSRQFSGSRTSEGGINITPVAPVDESKRHMVKFNKKNPVHNELIRSIGTDSGSWRQGTMKQDLDKIMLHSGGYFSFPKSEAPSKTESKPKKSEAVAKPKPVKRGAKKATTSESVKSKPAAPVGPQPVKEAPKKKSGGVWGDYEAKLKSVAEETAKKKKK